MKKLKKILRILSLILFIVLASVGVGIGGAAPVLPKSKEKNAGDEVKIELLDVQKEKHVVTEEKKKE